MAVGRLGRLQCEKEHLSEGCNAHAHHASVFKALVIPISVSYFSHRSTISIVRLFLFHFFLYTPTATIDWLTH